MSDPLVLEELGSERSSSGESAHCLEHGEFGVTCIATALLIQHDTTASKSEDVRNMVTEKRTSLSPGQPWTCILQEA